MSSIFMVSGGDLAEHASEFVSHNLIFSSIVLTCHIHLCHDIQGYPQRRMNLNAWLN